MTDHEEQNAKNQQNQPKRLKQTITAGNLAELSKLLSDIGEPEQESPAPEPTPQEKRLAYYEFRNCTFTIVSIMGYLIGVGKEMFGHGEVPFLQETYTKLNQNKDARIIRNLCRLRTAMEHNYVAIVNEFRMNIKNIGSVPDLIPAESVDELETDGVRIYKSRPEINEYLIAVNLEISNRINKISGLFPEWIKWEYIKPIFLMPNGSKKEGIKKAGDFYNSDRQRYPYQCWINWNAMSVSPENKGNILYNDEKFVSMIYERNEDRFENLSLVRDVGNQTMRNLGSLLSHSRRCVIVVDCENSDAVKLAAALSSLPAGQADKIAKVLLFDSEYTTDQWKTLVDRSLQMAVKEKTLLELEHIVVPRVNQNKSQVDMTLAVRTSREVFQGNADAVILVSSDSDYWAMISQLENTKFLVMLEKSKTGYAIMDTLMLHGISFCFIDDFCTAASYSIKTSTLLSGIQNQIRGILSGQSDQPFNVRRMMENTLQDSWITMTEKEKEVFFNRYLLHMKLEVDPDGTVSINLGNG